MLPSLVYLAVRRLLRLLTAGGGRDDVARDIEILVLRHQLRVLGGGRRLALRRRWSRPAGGDRRAAAPQPVAVFPGVATDCAALAPRAREAQVELPK